MQFTSKTDFITLTYSRQLCMLAKQYDDAINFTLGDPDLATPRPICDAAYKAMLEGKTHYAPNAGIPELRHAICDYVNRKKGGQYNSEQCIVTIGAVSAIYLSFMALLNPGDEVIIIAPYWSQYKNMVRLMDCQPVILDKLDDDFNPDMAELGKLITPKTKAIVVNSPNNPSGHIYPKNILEDISALAVRYGLYVFADEVYDSLVYDTDYCSLVSCCPQEHLLLFNSCSKSFAMTGWRVGYMLGPVDFVKSVIKLQQNVVASVPTMTQYAALEAFTHASEYVHSVVDVFVKRREVLIEHLSKVGKLKFKAPEGTFYAFIDISQTGLDSKAFAYGLLEKEHVAVVPGIAYGDTFDKYIRLAFTQNEDVIAKGVEKIKNFLE